MAAKSLLLRDVPKDIWEILLKKQSEVKKSKVSAQFSLASAAYKIIRDNEKLNPNEQKT